jgi:hypothetical protein
MNTAAMIELLLQGGVGLHAALPLSNSGRDAEVQGNPALLVFGTLCIAFSGARCI